MRQQGRLSSHFCVIRHTRGQKNETLPKQKAGLLQEAEGWIQKNARNFFSSATEHLKIYEHWGLICINRVSRREYTLTIYNIDEWGRTLNEHVGNVATNCLLPL